VIGETLAHYEILEKLGSGGMGEVYRARDTKLNRDVALKVLPSEMARAPGRLNRFEREARAVASLKHPNIVTIYSVEEVDGVHFLTMELVEGQTLSDTLRRSGLPLDRFFDLAIPLVDAISSAHAKGITHRDLKPANIMTDQEGRLKVLDFGLAKLLETDKESAEPQAVTVALDTSPTQEGWILGTAAYMSPEQAEGKLVDHRSDIFSLGIIFYEMITGQRPFHGDSNASTISAILRDTPTSITELKPNLPRHLARIIQHCLAKSPDRRYQSVLDVRNELEELKREIDSGELLPTGESSPSVELPPRRKVSKALVGVSVIALIALLVLVIKPWRLGVGPTQEAQASESRLAIMYFDNLADPDDSRKLGEITTNLLIADLSESEHVQVASSQRLYDILKLLGREGEKKITRDVATQVAKEARARWMLLGSILQIEPRMIVTAQLVEVETGNAIASQRITGGDGEQVFTIVDKLTAEIRKDLSLPLAAGEPDRPIAETTTHSQLAYRYYLEGVDKYWKQYFSEAKADFTKALEFDSTFAMAYYRLSMPGMGTPEEIKDMAVKAVRYSEGAGQKERQYIECRLAVVEGDFEQAIREFQQIVKRHPEEKEAHFAMGYYCYTALGRFDEAIAHFNKAIELDPLFTQSYNQLAYLYNDLDQLEKSIWAINRYISVAPDEANPYDTKGEIYAANGMLDEAIESFKKAIEIKPDYYASWTSLGYMYVFKKQYEEAEKCYERLMSDPRKVARTAGRFGLALIPVHQGRLDLALATFDQGIAADRMERVPEWSQHITKADVYAARDDAEQGLEEIQNGIRAFLAHRDGQVVPFRHIEILFLSELGRYAEAEETLMVWKERIDSDDPSKMGVYWMGLGSLEYGRGNYEKAARALTNAAEELRNRLHPVGYRARLFLAKSYQEWGKLGEAVAEYERLLSNYSAGRIGWCASSVMMHYSLGLCYEQSGWTDKAIEQYETFLDIWKNADEGLASVDDARARLAQLKSES
jgi:serine/threonine protein kinase/tetratricopeptide (TPR) repeat protein